MIGDEMEMLFNDSPDFIDAVNILQTDFDRFRRSKMMGGLKYKKLKNKDG